MASEEHKELAQFLKNVHCSLRQSSRKLGAEKAWSEHCGNNDVLIAYAQCMEKLATVYWENSCTEETNGATSRIKWTVDICYNYFINKSYVNYMEREVNIAMKIDAPAIEEQCFPTTLKLIDVGSCYNPFKKYDIFDVVAIDLCPANNSVLQCDFLNVEIGLSNIDDGHIVKQLQERYYDVVTFCFLLEYIPSSELRIRACEKAYSILKPGGLLIINTPDSKHVGANYKIMKCWRYALACIGFNRIKYEKFKYMHCMAFRKNINKDTAVRWANIHKEPYMDYSMHIPQDFNTE